MDTSKEYIKMCDCPEIQGQWRYRHDNVISTIDGVLSDLRNRSLREKYTWLPRQGQIQEMMRKDYENTLDMLCDFYAVITVDQPTGFQQMFEVSMEQLWLVFYILEKHGKIWDGKKWTKSE